MKENKRREDRRTRDNAADGIRSLPLDRPRRLAGNIVRNPIDPPDLIHDPPGHPLRIISE